MPSSSAKQRKTMSAIAHGWKPKGKVADIPVPVAKEFHAADKGKKFGQKGASASVPPAKGPAPPRGKGESKPHFDRSGHFPGNPGFPKSKGATMGKKAMANAPVKNVKSSLAGEEGHGHSDQPDGHSIGVGQHKPNLRGLPHGGDRHIFRGASAPGADGFGHGAHLRRGPLRLSGVAGAHRVGSRSK